jgi:hypothetical protein
MLLTSRVLPGTQVMRSERVVGTATSHSVIIPAASSQLRPASHLSLITLAPREGLARKGGHEGGAPFQPFRPGQMGGQFRCEGK